MESYTIDVPALPPLASGHHDFPAPAIERGGPKTIENLVASVRQLMDRSISMLSGPGRVSNEELAAAIERHHILSSLHFNVAPSGNYVPSWVQTLDQQQSAVPEADLKSAILKLRECVQQLQQRFNRSIGTKVEPLDAVVRVRDGTYPGLFPSTWYELENAASHVVEDLILFYELSSDGSLAQKRQRLLKFLGFTVTP